MNVPARQNRTIEAFPPWIPPPPVTREQKNHNTKSTIPHSHNITSKTKTRPLR